MGSSIRILLDKAIRARDGMFDAPHHNALRLFNGFYEGCPDLVVDLYATTIVMHNYAAQTDYGRQFIRQAQEFLQERLPWLRAGILKMRNGHSLETKRGLLLFGEAPDRKVQEHGVWYALDLSMHQDASLYLDTRNLRHWAIEHLRDLSVLNTFAYTGSLGAAAWANGASRVVQMDLDRQFLNIAKMTYTLNGFPIRRSDFLCGDFWLLVSRLKRAGELFDCVFLDPPFFSTTAGGAIDLNLDSARLINKVRPLIRDGGWLVAVNNALYVSGKEYLATLETLCADGYLKISELVPVPEDITGFAETRIGTPVTDPAPFNHSTKIAVLVVRRKNS